jgi:propanediol dehydratase small subunit
VETNIRLGSLGPFTSGSLIPLRVHEFLTKFILSVQQQQPEDQKFRTFEKAIQLVGVPDDFILDEETEMLMPRE